MWSVCVFIKTSFNRVVVSFSLNATCCVCVCLLVVCVFSLIALEDEDMEITLPVRCLQVFWHFFWKCLGQLKTQRKQKLGPTLLQLNQLRINYNTPKCLDRHNQSLMVATTVEGQSSSDSLILTL